MGEFAIRVQRDRNRAIIRVEGELDIASVPTLRDSANAALSSSDSQALVLDLGGLTFIDSSGIGCFVALRTAADRATKTVTLAHVPRFAARIFTLGGLDSLFGLESASDRSQDPPADQSSTLSSS